MRTSNNFDKNHGQPQRAASEMSPAGVDQQEMGACDQRHEHRENRRKTTDAPPTTMAEVPEPF